jgi:hypothetical protein
MTKLNWLNYKDFIMDVGNIYKEGETFFMWIKPTGRDNIEKLKTKYYIFNGMWYISTDFTDNPEDYSHGPGFWKSSYRGKFAFDDIELKDEESDKLLPQWVEIGDYFLKISKIQGLRKGKKTIYILNDKEDITVMFQSEYKCSRAYNKLKISL